AVVPDHRLAAGRAFVEGDVLGRVDRSGAVDGHQRADRGPQVRHIDPEVVHRAREEPGGPCRAAGRGVTRHLSLVGRASSQTTYEAARWGSRRSPPANTLHGSMLVTFEVPGDRPRVVG